MIPLKQNKTEKPEQIGQNSGPAKNYDHNGSELVKSQSQGWG